MFVNQVTAVWASWAVRPWNTLAASEGENLVSDHRIHLEITVDTGLIPRRGSAPGNEQDNENEQHDLLRREHTG